MATKRTKSRILSATLTVEMECGKCGQTSTGVTTETSQWTEAGYYGDEIVTSVIASCPHCKTSVEAVDFPIE